MKQIFYVYAIMYGNSIVKLCETMEQAKAEIKKAGTAVDFHIKSMEVEKEGNY